MAAVRLEDEGDSIDKILIVALVDGKAGASSSKSITSVDPLASSTWDEVIRLLMWFVLECKQKNWPTKRGKIRFFPLIGQSSLHSSECKYFVWDLAGDDHQLNYVKIWIE